jgi:hypothetical protein
MGFDAEHLKTLLIEFIQHQPLLFAASLSLFFSTFYMSMMILTRLGDIKPGIQSLVLSAVLHGVFMFFFGAVMVTAQESGPAQTVEIPVRQVVVPGEDAQDAIPDNNAPVWDRLPTQQREEVSRTESAPTNQVAANADRTAPAPTEIASAMPNLPNAPEVKDNPLAMRQETAREKSAVAESVSLEEETAAARSETPLENTPRRQVRESAGMPNADVARESPRGQAQDSRIEIEPVPQLASTNVLNDPAARVLRGPSSPPAKMQTGAAPIDLAVDEPGIPNGGEGEPGRGRPEGSKFSRLAGRTLNGEGAGTGERPTRTAPTRTPRTANADSTPLASTTGGRDMPTTREAGPSVRRPNLASIPQQGASQAPATYRLRHMRRGHQIPEGATRDSERAVELSLKWLAEHQSPAGNWDPNGFTALCPTADRCWGVAGLAQTEEGTADRRTAGADADVGVTALVVLAFLGAGYTHEEDQYADNVDRAIRWLVRQQTPDGFLGGKATRYEKMYCHGMATYALAEALGMSSDPNNDPMLRQALARATQYIIDVQNRDDGGWRYLPGQKGDMSMFGWQLMALKSSEIAGLEMPAETRAGMVKFLKNSGLGEHGGLAAYRTGERVSPSMTAEALFSRQMLGMRRTNPATTEAVEFLMSHPPKQADQDLYYWYYGTLAMYQYGGEPWQQWNSSLRDTLVASQRQSGHAAGSWDPRDHWSKYGGRVYSTALSTLCLEVYYRFLRLHQLSDPVSK